MLDAIYQSLFNQESLNDYFNQVYVITLKKRRDYVKQTFRQMKIRYNQFDAITKDNKDMSPATLIKKGILSPNNTFKHNNEIYCYLSHIGVIKRFYESAANETDTCFIFEDDIVLDTDYLPKVKNVMENLPADWEFINLSSCWNNCKNNIKINEHIAISERALCASAYGVTKAGARKILKWGFPIIDPVDIYYVSLQGAPQPIKMYISTPRIFNQLKSIMDLKSTLINSKENNGPSYDKNIFTSSLENDDKCLECTPNNNSAVPVFKPIDKR